MSPLRRTGPLQRFTPLRSSKPLVSHSELTRSPIARKIRTHEEVRSARRPLVSPEERRARKLVKKRSEGRCEVCGRAPATNFQHRLSRAHLGPWTAENGLAVCGHGNLTGCHSLIHLNPRVAYERGWSVRSGHDPARIPVWLANRGFHLLTADGGTTPIERNAA